jgi:hypothetical protein
MAATPHAGCGPLFGPAPALHVVSLQLDHQHPSDGHHVVWGPLRGRPTPALYVV